MGNWNTHTRAMGEDAQDALTMAHATSLRAMTITAAGTEQRDHVAIFSGTTNCWSAQLDVDIEVWRFNALAQWVGEHRPFCFPYLPVFLLGTLAIGAGGIGGWTIASFAAATVDVLNQGGRLRVANVCVLVRMSCH